MEMKDSGERQQFDDGAMRDTAEGKPDMSLLGPYAWENLPHGTYVRDYMLTHDIQHMQKMFSLLVGTYSYARLCEWLRQGAVKYDRFNWARGMPISRCLASLGRHLLAMQNCADDEDHAAAAMCNVSFIIHYHRAIQDHMLPKHWDDVFEFNRMKEHDEKKD
jgi:hypothetical protein